MTESTKKIGAGLPGNADFRQSDLVDGDTIFWDATLEKWVQGAGGGFALPAAIFAGTGTPEGAQTAVVGSLFMRSDGGANTSLYVKESGTGNTGWVGK